jgi:hypothetical protein
MRHLWSGIFACLTVITDIDIDFLREWKNALLAYSTSDTVGKRVDRIINSIDSYPLGLYLGTIYFFLRACDSLYSKLFGLQRDNSL